MPQEKSSNKKVPFEQVVNALLDENHLFPPSYLHRFSDIKAQDLEHLRKVWLQVNPTRRQSLLEDLEELAESDTMVLFNDVARFALSDPDAGVRATAIRLLWEDQDLKLIPVYINMMENDADSNVRAAAASALGLFVYLGELEEIPADTLRSVEDTLLRGATGPEQALIRRRALEALGYSSREEVPPLIQAGYDSEDTEWQSSALFAMGRSADPRWESAVTSMLDHVDVGIQLEAVRAAGQLELASAREPLLAMLDDGEEVDDDVFAAVIWSLSQIGGESVRERLEALADETDDDDEAEYIERALENLSFTEDFEIFDMFDFDADNKNAAAGMELDDDEEDDEDGRGNGKTDR